MKVLVTGSAGFIGSALTLRLLERGDEVVGVDNLNDYYEVNLKLARLARCKNYSNFTEARIGLHDQPAVMDVFTRFKPQRVVNLAAQPGVRYSLENPHAYIDSNIVGFMNILEGCRYHEVAHLVYASSSSVYGANAKIPYSEHDRTDHPLNLYGASKKANELMAYSYSHLFKLPATGLRFFTVYGPWGRPDMMPFLFTRKILADETIDVYNYGHHRRDFTYIDDIVEGVVRALDNIPTAKADDAGQAPYRLYNIGNHDSVELLHFIELLEKSLGKQAKKNLLPLQPGEVLATYANVDDLTRDLGYHPSTSIEEGIPRFVDWYKEYYRI